MNKLFKPVLIVLYGSPSILIILLHRLINELRIKKCLKNDFIKLQNI